MRLWAAPDDKGSTSNKGGGAVKWKIGSATPQNINPMPIPAEINIAYQAPEENSGRALGPPNRILPYLPNAK